MVHQSPRGRAATAGFRSRGAEAIELAPLRSCTETDWGPSSDLAGGATRTKLGSAGFGEVVANVRRHGSADKAGRDP